jgi:hypothetical protein
LVYGVGAQWELPGAMAGRGQRPDAG